MRTEGPSTRAHVAAPNNFDGLRLLGALAVLLGHAFVLTGRVKHVPGVFGFGIHELGVYVFFCISGFLISASWNRSRSPWTYWTARTLRIFPGLVLVVLATVLVVGPLVTTVGLRAYANDPLTTQYLANIDLRPVYGLPGVFATNGVSSAVNGSLWSLPAEFFCYIAVPFLLWRRRAVAAGLLVVALAACIVLMRFPMESLPVVHGTSVGLCLPLWACFAAGALIQLGVERWPGLLRVDVAVALLACYSLVVSSRPELVTKWAWVVVPFVVLAVGTRSTPVLRRSARFGDLSYGIYLWAFPIQQVVIWRFGSIPMVLNLAIVGTASAGAAWLSWHLVEARAVRFGKRLGRMARRSVQPVVEPAPAVDRVPTA